MFKIIALVSERSLLTKCSEYDNFLCNSVKYQIFRWKRHKPRWLPMAPSKVFRIPERVQIPQDERTEMKRLADHYKTFKKSLRLYLRNQQKVTLTDPAVLAREELARSEEEETCWRINEDWNKEVGKKREERLEKEREERLAEVLKDLEERRRQEETIRAQAAALLRLEIENSKTFITEENIESAIEEALAKEKDHDFCIDLEGNIFKGKRGRPGAGGCAGGGTEKGTSEAASEGGQATQQAAL